jgi:alpha-D-xyloside xylohydrolase
MPLFVKAGSIISTAEGLQYACQKPEGKICLEIFPGADGDFTLYEDAEDGYGYEACEFTLTHLHWDDEKKQLTVDGAEDEGKRFEITMW